jgi:hypothetical protein
MSKTNKIIIGVILAAVLLLGVGYAAIQNISLNITGTAKADVSQSSFVVGFAKTTQVSDPSKVTASVTNGTNAVLNVAGLTAKGDSVTATYTLQNTSPDLSANLSIQSTNSNEEYFTVETEIGKTSLESGEATTLTVTITLIKTPITDNITSTIGLQLTSEPVQPGEEGEPEGGNGGDTSGSEGTEPDVTSITLEHEFPFGVPVDLEFDVVAITSPNANPTGTFEFEIAYANNVDVEITSVEGNTAYVCVHQASDLALFVIEVIYKPDDGGESVSVTENFTVDTTEEPHRPV